MTEKRSNLIDVGRITSVFGIKGWVKIHSDTEPADNIFTYTPWWVKTRHGVKEVEISEFRVHGKGFVAHIKGVDDRDAAELFTKVNIAVERQQLAVLEDGDYYWHQLEGLRVVSVFNESEQCLGFVSHLLETGANDVLAVKPGDGSIDDVERLIPFVPGQFVKKIDLEQQVIVVDWDPAF